MARTICGRPGRGGEPCPLDAGDCPDHARAVDSREVSRAVTPPWWPDAIGRRDVRGATWWVVERLATGELSGRDASGLVSALRLLASLGPAPMDEEEALAEVELRGIIMAGLQPRNAEEWALARRLFSEEALQLLGRPEEADDEEDWDAVGGEGAWSED